MQILRSLLNSGVFMVLLVVAVSVYLAYSEQIQASLEELEVTSSNVLSNMVEKKEVSASVSPVEETKVEAAPAVVAQAPAVAEQAPVVAEQAPVAAEQAPVVAEQVPVVAEQAPLSVMPELPPMPAMPELAAMPELPPMPAMPELAAMPELPPMPAMPEVAAMPELPPMPAMPEVAVMQPAVVAMPVMPESVQADMGSVLEDARRAFQAGNLDEAEAKYRAILSTSESPDAYGELGNIFFSRRQFNDANDAYLKAAEGLIAQNRLLQAQYVIGVLMNTQPEYAQQAMQAFNAKLHNAR